MAGEVQTGHVEDLLASQDRQSAGPAPHLEHPCAVRGHGSDVGRDPLEERAQQEPVAQRVVEGGIADEDPTRHSSAHPTARVPHDDDGGGGRSEHDHERSRSGDHEAFEVGRS
jgi:hypothetical protein